MISIQVCISCVVRSVSKSMLMVIKPLFRRRLGKDLVKSCGYGLVCYHTYQGGRLLSSLFEQGAGELVD